MDTETNCNSKTKWEWKTCATCFVRVWFCIPKILLLWLCTKQLSLFVLHCCTFVMIKLLLQYINLILWKSGIGQLLLGEFLLFLLGWRDMFWWQLSTDPDQVHKPESVLRVALSISILFSRSFFSSFNLLLFLVSRLIIHLQVFEVRKLNFLASWKSHIVHVNTIPATARVSKCVRGIPRLDKSRCCWLCLL